MSNAYLTVYANEIYSALNSLPGKKAPGEDGLTSTFYVKFWPELNEKFREALNFSLIHGEMSPSQKRSVIRLIEKKNKDKLKISNWRPISLINIDTKIFSKCLANRLKMTISPLISHAP